MRARYDRRSVLWPSVIRELTLFAHLVPLIFQDLRSGWTDDVMATDASEPVKRKFDQMRGTTERSPPVRSRPMTRRPLLGKLPQPEEKRRPLRGQEEMSSDHHRRGGLSARRKEKLRVPQPGLSVC